MSLNKAGSDLLVFNCLTKFIPFGPQIENKVHFTGSLMGPNKEREDGA